MPIDIELSALTAGGINEVRADWTATADRLVSEAVREELSTRNDELLEYEIPRDASDRDMHTQIIKLHGAVGTTMLLYASAPVTVPPTKRDVFDWSLGKQVTVLRDSTGADYGLFVYLRDSYAPPGARQ